MITDSGVPFTGHTEYLAERTRAPLPVMMLASKAMRVALATTHLPLKDVSAAITIDSLCKIVTILHHDLRNGGASEQPRIAVCGLNPHAGESGHLGDEEIRVIGPAIAHLMRSAASMSADRYRRTRHSCRASWPTSTQCWPCITTRACR